MRFIKSDASKDDVVAAPYHARAELIHGSLYHGDTDRLGEVDHLWWPLAKLAVRAYRKRMDEFDGENAPFLELGPHVLRPEGAFWLGGSAVETRELDEHHRAKLTPPTLVIEYVNDETEPLVRDHKLPIYLGAGTSVIWLLNLSQRTFTILVADGEAWRVHDLKREGSSITLHPFACDLVLRTYWDSYAQREAKVRAKVGQLADAVAELAQDGMSERDQVLMLLASLRLQPLIPFACEEVVSRMLSSFNVPVRASMLMYGRISLEHALTLSRAEIAAERELLALKLDRDEAVALCERYCELLELHGPHAPEVRARAPVAHAFARNEMRSLWYRRGDDTADDEAVAKLAAFHETGADEEQVLALVARGRGLRSTRLEDWEHALAAFIAKLPARHRVVDAKLRSLLVDIEELAAPSQGDEYEEDHRDEAAETANIYFEGEDEPMTGSQFVARIMDEARARPPDPDDIALCWRKQRENRDLDDDDEMEDDDD